jgi:surface carbohydrate biosynthesis protein
MEQDMAFLKTDLTIIYCDSRRRDSTVAILLQELLKKRGQLSFVASRRNFSKILKLATPANIVMIGQINIVYDLVYDVKSLKARFKDTNIYFYPSEGYATDNEYHMMYPERFNYRDTKKIFFWGRESLEWVRRHLDIAPETLDNTGYPRTRMARIYAALRGKKIAPKIGIVGRFAMLNDLYGVLPMEYVVTEFSLAKQQYKGAMVSRLHVESATIVTILRAVDFIMKNTDYRVSMRPHPNEAPASYAGLKKLYGDRFEISDEVDVADWLSGCTKIMGLASSTYIDASLLDVPVICLDRVSGVVDQTMAYEPALRLIYEAAHLPADFDELTTLLTQDIAPKRSPVFSALIESNFTGEHIDPIKHVAASIAHLPARPTTALIKLAIEAADRLLVARDLLRKSPALDFEYSATFHGRSKAFIQRYLDGE